MTARTLLTAVSLLFMAAALAGCSGAGSPGSVDNPTLGGGSPGVAPGTSGGNSGTGNSGTQGGSSGDTGGSSSGTGTGSSTLPPPPSGPYSAFNCTPGTGVGTGSGASTEIDSTVTDLDGSQRDIIYFVPNPMPTTCMPVVVFLTYLRGGAAQMEKLTRADRLAKQYGVFVAILPPANNGSWNDNPTGQPNGTLGLGATHDIGFIGNQIAGIIDSYPVDFNRIYLAGYSNSGYMAVTFACQRPGLVAGLAEIAATTKGKIEQGCSSLPPSRIVMFSGTKDLINNYNGVFPNGPAGQSNSFIIAGAQQGEQLWEKHDGCSVAGRKTTQLPAPVDDGTTITLTENDACSGNSAVALYTINGGGHTWPGNQVSTLSSAKNNLVLGKTTQNLDATLVLWKFLAGESDVH
ncbi:MAG TPA: hypothetical protein VFQ88_12995 [Nevskiaceae bacterium]|nr:hypothetical protein [Nevskiaceae bacterium]